MDCIFCHQPLEISQTRDNGGYKSCPKCSQANGQEHVYYPCDQFGYSDKRVTSSDPTGIQSWCTVCRKGNEVNGTGILCNAMRP